MRKKLVSLIVVCSIVVVMSVPVTTQADTGQQPAVKMTTNSHGLGS